MSSHETETIRETIHNHYAEIARATLAGIEEALRRGCCTPISGCGSVTLDATTLATSIGKYVLDLEVVCTIRLTLSSQPSLCGAPLSH
jgi:hypothetical protein